MDMKGTKQSNSPYDSKSDRDEPELINQGLNF